MIARDFIGADLAPTDLYSEQASAISKLRADAAEMDDTDHKAAELSRISTLEKTVRAGSAEWRNWYYILKRYFGIPDEDTRERFYGYIFLHSLGWAGIVLFVISRRLLWFPFISCLAAVVYGLLGLRFRMYSFGYREKDNQWIPLAARMLQELQLRSGRSQETNLKSDVTHRHSRKARANSE